MLKNLSQMRATVAVGVLAAVIAAGAVLACSDVTGGGNIQSDTSPPTITLTSTACSGG